MNRVEGKTYDWKGGGQKRIKTNSTNRQETGNTESWRRKISPEDEWWRKCCRRGKEEGQEEI